MPVLLVVSEATTVSLAMRGPADAAAYRPAPAVPLHARCKMSFMSDTDKPEETQEEFHIPLPPASFSFLVLSLRAQAEMQLGLMQFGQEEKTEPDLDLARHTIDMLGILLEKTKGNLVIEEQRLLENSLTELRFRFVQASGEADKAATQKS
jgi:hypothetical protein